MDATNTLDQAPLKGDQATATPSDVEQDQIRVLRPIEMSMVGGGTGAALFF